MFLNRELNVISGKKSIPQKELNSAMDKVGLPFGFKYSKPRFSGSRSAGRFLLYGIRTVHEVEVIGDTTYRVPSESTAGKFYNVTLDPLSCECPAFHRFKVTPYPLCKHIVAAMVKEQDVTDAFFDGLIEKHDGGDLDDYIQARFVAGNASTSILDNPQTEHAECLHTTSTPQKSVTIFSSSQLDTYTRCPAQYYFRYQKRVPDESPLSPALAFDRCFKATIYAHFGYEPEDNIPLEDKWKPELDIAVDAMSDGMKIDEVFAETFQWLINEKPVEWTDEKEESEMFKKGGILAKSFDKEFGSIEATPLVSMRVPMVDKETGAVVTSNGTPASVQCSLDLVSDDGVILKLKTSSRSISKLEYDWSLDLQRYAYEQIKKRPNFRTSRESGQAPVEVKVVNLVRTKKPKIQVIDAPEPSRESGLAICESVIASINAGAFYPNPKNQFGCFLCGYATACEQQW